jgi:outer membrane lipoprotein-sorting protein
MRLCALVAALCPTGPALAESGATHPDAGSVIERYLEASGGRAHLSSIESLHATGTVTVPDQGLDGRIEVWLHADGRSRATLEIDGLGTVEEGTLPDLAWENSLMGPRIKRGEEKALALRNAAIEPLLDWRDRYESAEVEGMVSVGDRKAYRLVLTAPGGAEETRLIDTESFLPLGTEQTLDSPMGEIRTQSRVLETRTVDGLVYPVKVEQTAAGMRMVLELERLELDAEVPDGTFTPPDAVQRMAESG